MSTQKNAFILVKIHRTHGHQVEDLVAAYEDPIFANQECARFNNGVSNVEFSKRPIFEIRIMPILTRRKTRHPFMQRGKADELQQIQQEEVQVKIRGRLAKRNEMCDKDR